MQELHPANQLFPWRYLEMGFLPDLQQYWRQALDHQWWVPHGQHLVRSLQQILLLQLFQWLVQQG